MRVDRESGASRRFGRHRIDAAIVDLGNHAARGANEVMVVRGFARNVCMAPVGEVHALDESLGNEQLEEAKDRGAPYVDATSPRIGHEVGGGEMALALGDQTRYGTPRSGEGDPGPIDRPQERWLHGEILSQVRLSLKC